MGAYSFFGNQGAYSHKIHSGTITAKVALPETFVTIGKTLRTTPETFILMVQKDTITEKFEVNKEKYEALHVGDAFEEGMK